MIYSTQHLLTFVTLKFICFNHPHLLSLTIHILIPILVLVFVIGHERVGDSLEAFQHLLDVAGEVLAAAHASEEFVEALHERSLHLEGVVHVLDDMHDSAVVVADVHALGAGLAGAPEFVSVGADKLGGLDEIDDSHISVVGSDFMGHV